MRTTTTTPARRASTRALAVVLTWLVGAPLPAPAVGAPVRTAASTTVLPSGERAREASATAVSAGAVPVVADAAPRPALTPPIRPVASVEPRLVLPELAAAPPGAMLRFSDPPTAAELSAARVFDEPLAPLGGAGDPAENAALGMAMRAFAAAPRDSERAPFVVFEEFLRVHARSVWRAALLAGLAVAYRRTGYYSRSLAAADEAWGLAKDDTSLAGVATAHRALGELVELHARLGHVSELRALLAQVVGRRLSGPISERLEGAQQGLWMMENLPEEAFRCGPLALDSLLATRSNDYVTPQPVAEMPSTRQGTSLLQMKELAQSVGLTARPLRREPGGPVPVPAMVHWRAGHFAALVREAGGYYLVKDPTFGDELWVSRHALDDEASGAFLVLSERLESGWTALDDAQAAAIWGKGSPPSQDPQYQACEDGDPCPGGCPPLTQYGFKTMLAALTLGDTPLSYAPPRGPALRLRLTYNQRDVFQPQTFAYSNLGPKWTFDWFSYIEDDPGNPAQTVKVYRRGGGVEPSTAYDPATASYAPGLRTRAVVVRTSSTPIRYERRLPDGGTEVFALPVGTASVPRRVLMTEIVDSNGLRLKLVYDGFLRLAALVDALGQVTTLAYETADHLKITRVTDPFGRSARFTYDSQGRLASITDVLGLTSEFAYDTGDFVTALTTPYGTTRFETSPIAGAIDRWVQATDPLGGVERVQSSRATSQYPASDPVALVPPGASNFGLNRSLSLRWSKRAMATAPLDPASADVTHWLWATVITGIKRAHKRPLENRVWYFYPGQIANQPGTRAEATRVARVLDDGSVQQWRYEFNQAGMPIKTIDPVDRETTYVYGTGSTPDPDPANGRGLDRLEVRQKNPSNPAGYDLLSRATYDARHLILTSTDAAQQTTTYTYNADGQVATVTTPPRAGVDELRTTTYGYTPAGYLQSISGPAAGQVTSYTYDGYGRLASSTDDDGHTLTYEYDNADRVVRVNHPDGSYEQTDYRRLDVEGQRDRLGRWSEMFYDALRRPVSGRDALGRMTQQQWCACGSLDRIVDARGNATSFAYDVQGRLVSETRPGGATTAFTYENATGRLKRRTDARGQFSDYEYFKDDSLKQVSYPNAVVATPAVSFTYDPHHDRLATMTDGVGVTTYSYHPVVNPPGTAQLGATQVAGVSGPLAGAIVNYTYDELGRVVVRGLPGWSTVAALDSLGRLSSQTAPVGVFSYAYDGFSARLATLLYPNNQRSDYVYLPNTGDRRLQSIQHSGPGGSPLLSRFEYTYDTVGNIKAWSQQYAPGVPQVYELAYDAADQLTAATLKTGGPPPVLLKRYAYGYDAAGNRTSEQNDDLVTTTVFNNRNQGTNVQAGGPVRFRGTLNEPASVTVTPQGGSSIPAEVAGDNTFEARPTLGPGTSTVAVQATDPANNTRTNNYQLTLGVGATTAYTYDANGNLASDGLRTFEWDAENRLRRVLQGATVVAAFEYDGRGRRVRKTTGGAVRDYVYDEEDIIEERVSSGLTLRLVHGPGVDRPLAQQVVGGSVVFLLADHLGSIVQQTGTSGTVTFTRQYDPWGTLLVGASAGRHAFTGREWDPEIGLYYYRARYYDPKTGRFIREDPVGFEGGLNLYAYVLNNPTNSVDPEGLAGNRGGPWHPPTGVHTACTPGDDCSTIKRKIWLLLRMIRSHQGWDRRMPAPRGGGRHATEIAQLWIQLAGCQALYIEKCLNKPTCDDECKEKAKKAATAGAAAAGAYITYRCIRMIPSLFPPLWPTIPVNAAAP